jgi:hypothetical protein
MKRGGTKVRRVTSYVAVIATVLIIAVSASLYLGHGTSSSSSTRGTSTSSSTFSTSSSSSTPVVSSSSSPPVSATSTNSLNGSKVGSEAPDFQVQLTNGTTARLSDFRGHRVLLWFVTIGCSSCAIGAQLLSQQYYSQLHNKGVIILTVQLYNNLGFDPEGSSINDWATQFGGASPGWLFGTSNQNTTYTYDPKALLDTYYTLDSQGRIMASGTPLATDLPSMVSTF